MIKDVGERGIGLASMDERSRMLGGSLEVWSERGHGTRVTLRIPTGKKESA
jgi:signal transduction histidine kinase